LDFTEYLSEPHIKQYIAVHLKYIAEGAEIQDEEEFREIIRKGLTNLMRTVS